MDDDWDPRHPTVMPLTRSWRKGAVVIVVLLVILLARNWSEPAESEEVSRQGPREQVDDASMWIVRRVVCEETLSENSRAAFPFENRLGRSVRIIGIRSSCSCTHVALQVGGREYRVRERGVDRGILTVIGGREKVVPCVDVESGQTGTLFADIKVPEGKRDATIWIRTESTREPVVLSMQGSRRHVIWGEPRVLELGELKRGFVPFSARFYSRDPQLFTKMKVKGHGVPVGACHIEFCRDDSDWCWKVVGFLAVQGESGDRVGRIDIDGLDATYVQRAIVVRGRLGG